MLALGPLWVFYISTDNINYNDNDDPAGWYVRNSGWHLSLLANTDFGGRVFAKWRSLMRDGTVPGLVREVVNIVTGIARVTIGRNFKRRDILGTYVWPNAFVGDTYDEEGG